MIYMKHLVNIFNQTHVRLSEDFFKNIVVQILDNLKVKKSCELSIILCSKKDITKLNKDYRGVDGVTDILSFGLLNTRIKNIDNPDKILHLGDIWICLSIAREQSKIKKHSLRLEIVILLIHGIIHLFGHDHNIKKGKDEMDTLTEKILKKVYSKH